MKKRLTLEIPTTWADITLRKYLALQTDLANYSDDEEAQTALMLHHLCGLQPEYLQSLSKDSYNNIKSELAAFISPDNIELERFVYIDGVEYGFEPNLSTIAYGAYADISQYDTITIDKNWAKIMAILYRPVIKKMGKNYEIAPYDGKIDENMWLDVNMEIHFGCMFFFVNLLTDLQRSTLNSLKEMELPLNIKSILERNGNLIQQLQN